MHGERQRLGVGLLAGGRLGDHAGTNAASADGKGADGTVGKLVFLPQKAHSLLMVSSVYTEKLMLQNYRVLPSESWRNGNTMTLQGVYIGEDEKKSKEIFSVRHFFFR